MCPVVSSLKGRSPMNLCLGCKLSAKDIAIHVFQWSTESYTIKCSWMTLRPFSKSACEIFPIGCKQFEIMLSYILAMRGHVIGLSKRIAGLFSRM